MKINNMNDYELQSKYLENYKNKENLIPKDKYIREEGDVKIDISNSSRNLINKINQAKDTEFSKKVEDIRKSILEGKYTVSSDEIADKIQQTIDNQKGSE